MMQLAGKLQELVLEAIEVAIGGFTTDQPHPFVFFVDNAGEAHTLVFPASPESDGADLVQFARRAISQDVDHLAQCYALAYDGYVTVDGERLDAAFIEAAERGEPTAALIAQPYRVKKRSKAVERIGPPTVIGPVDQLLVDSKPGKRRRPPRRRDSG